MQQLLNTLVAETEIAQMELKVRVQVACVRARLFVAHARRAAQPAQGRGSALQREQQHTRTPSGCRGRAHNGICPRPPCSACCPASHRQTGTFHLFVRRNIDAPQAAPAPVATTVVTAPPPPAATPAPAPYVSMDYAPAEESVDETLVYVTVPKVRGGYCCACHGCTPRGTVQGLCTRV